MESGTQEAQRVLSDPLPSANPAPRPLPGPTGAMLCDSHLSQRSSESAGGVALQPQLQ